MAVRTISTKLAIDGESEYKRSITNINNSLKTLQSELSKVESEYQSNANSLEALDAKKKALISIQTKETEKVRELRSALENAQKAQQQHANAYTDYGQKISAAERKLSELKDATGDTTEEQEKLTKQIAEYKKAQTDAKASQDAATRGVEGWQKKLNLAERDLNNVNAEIQSTNKSIVEMTYNFKDLTDGLDQASTRLNSAGNAMTVGLTVPLIAAGTAAVNYASDTDESLNKVEVAFGSASESVDAWSKTTLTSIGLARGTALDMAALYGDMATAMGYGQKEAAQMSTTLVGLAADLASFKNISIDTANTALKSIFTGETESLKNLGVVMTQANLQNYALAQGFKTAYTEMSQAEQVAVRYQYVLSMTESAQGDFARTSDGTANQLRVLQESLKEAAATMGGDLLPVVTPIIKNLGELTQKFSDLDDETRKTVVRTGLFLAALGPALKITGGLAGVVSSAVSAYQALKTAQAAAAAGQTVLNASMSANPIGAVATAVGALVAVLGSLALASKLAGDGQENLNKQLKDTEQARLDGIASAEEEKNSTLEMVSALEDLTEQENKTEGQKQAILSLVDDLNEAVPNLSLAYDEQTDSLNMTAEAVRNLAEANAMRAIQEDNIEAISDYYRIIANAQEKLGQSEKDLADAQADLATVTAEAERQVLEFGSATNDVQIEQQRLSANVERARESIDEQNGTISDAQTKIDALSGKYENLTEKTEDATERQRDEQVSIEDLSDSYDKLTENSSSLSNATDTLASSLAEQEKTGSLNLNTVLKLIDAGYAAALSIDSETGAITINQDAYIKLAQAKIDEQIATIESARASASAIETQRAETLAAYHTAAAYYSVAESKSAAAGQIKSYNAQIAALNALKGSLSSFSYAAVSSAKASGSSSKKIRTQAENDAERFKDLQSELQYQRNMDQISEEEYYKKIAEYRDDYLTDDDNLDDYRKITEEIFKYDKSLAENEDKLWGEQTSDLVDALDDRLEEVTGKIDGMSGKLSDYGDLFAVEDNRMSLNSLQDQNDALDKYAETLGRLKEAGISDSLLNEVVSMNVDDAIAYGKKLLGMSPEQFEQYNMLWDEKQKKALEISAKFYADELETIESEYNDKLATSLDSLKSTAFTSGENTAQGLIDGLSEKEQDIYRKAKSIANEVSRLMSAAYSASSDNVDGSHAGGLPYVPYDGYVAELHEGERVLTADEAKRYIALSIPSRIGITPNSNENATAAMVNGLVGAMSQVQTTSDAGGTYNINLNVDGKTVAAAVFDPLKDEGKRRGESL